MKGFESNVDFENNLKHGKKQKNPMQKLQWLVHLINVPPQKED